MPEAKDIMEEKTITLTDKGLLLLLLQKVEDLEQRIKDIEEAPLTAYDSEQAEEDEKERMSCADAWLDDY